MNKLQDIKETLANINDDIDYMKQLLNDIESYEELSIHNMLERLTLVSKIEVLEEVVEEFNCVLYNRTVVK